MSLLESRQHDWDFDSQQRDESRCFEASGFRSTSWTLAQSCPRSNTLNFVKFCSPTESGSGTQSFLRDSSLHPTSFVSKLGGNQFKIVGGVRISRIQPNSEEKNDFSLQNKSIDQLSFKTKRMKFESLEGYPMSFHPNSANERFVALLAHFRLQNGTNHAENETQRTSTCAETIESRKV